jgi:hypothetical protein
MKKQFYLAFFCFNATLSLAQSTAMPLLLGTTDPEMPTKLVQLFVNYPDAVLEEILSDTVNFFKQCLHNSKA